MAALAKILDGGDGHPRGALLGLTAGADGAFLSNEGNRAFRFQMTKIFISYRRHDTMAIAGRI